MAVFYNESNDEVKHRLSNGEGMWPAPGQQLFVEPTDQTPKELAVDLDWLAYFNPTDKRMSDGYKEGADLLVEALRYGGTGVHPDQFMYPVIYLYRHAIELEMKSLIRMGIRKRYIASSEQLERTLGRHDLSVLWGHARAVLEAMWPKGDTTILDATESLVQQLHAVDPNGQQARYTHERDGSEIQTGLPDRVDLAHFRAIIDGLWSIVSANYSAPEYDTDEM